MSPLWRKIIEVTEFCEQLILHYVPGHVGLIGNEMADAAAKHAAKTFTNEEQDQVCAMLTNLKSYLNQTLQRDWITQQSARYTEVGF